jgi:hypothetical protein
MNIKKPGRNQWLAELFSGFERPDLNPEPVAIFRRFPARLNRFRLWGEEKMLQKLVNTLTLFLFVLILIGILWILTVYSTNLAIL